jgi:large subunit ribosomal protein L4
MKAAALRGALSDRARHQRVHVVRDFVAGDEPVTRQARTLLERITQRPRVLVVATGAEDVGRRSVRNLPQVHLLTPGQLNTYDVMVSDDVVFTEAALAEFLASPKSGLEPRPTHDGDRAASSAEATGAPKTAADPAPVEPAGGEAEDEPKEDAK